MYLIDCIFPLLSEIKYITKGSRQLGVPYFTIKKIETNTANFLAVLHLQSQQNCILESFLFRSKPKNKICSFFFKKRELLIAFVTCILICIYFKPKYPTTLKKECNPVQALVNTNTLTSSACQCFLPKPLFIHL
jgi:hypothetical protein